MGQESGAGDVKPGPSIDAANFRRAATFVRDEAPKMHPAFGGSPSLDAKDGPLEPQMQFNKRTLAVALRDYVPPTLRVDVGPDTNKVEWDGLFDEINGVEEKAHGTERGPRAIFSKLVLKVGENQEVIDPWLNLIPNEYGLAVVKCGIAIILNVAKRYAEERQKIFDALTEIRDTIGEANSKTRNFQQEAEISKCAALLHDAIVTAIQDILESLPKKKPPTEYKEVLHRLIPKFGKKKDAENKGKASKQKKTANENSEAGAAEDEPKKEEKKQKRKKINVDDVLEKARTAAKELDRAVDDWKTRTLKKTGEYSKDTNEQVAIMLNWIVSEADPINKETNLKAKKIEVKLLEVENRQIEVEHWQKREAKKQAKRQDKTNRILEMMHARDTADRNLLEMALDEMKKKCSNFQTKLRDVEEELRLIRAKNVLRSKSPKAIVTLAQLLRILFNLSFGQNSTEGKITDVNAMLDHLNDGLDTVIRRRTRVNVQDQGQTQAIFQETRFIAWLEGESPDMILVDGNMESCARDKVSAMSFFCANFVLTMWKIESQDLYTHYFCGLHDSAKDLHSGPRDLLQSIIVQLLRVLDERNILSLNFLSEKQQIEELKAGDMRRLCRVFHELVDQFPQETTVYCIIDGVQFFSRDACLADLEFLVRYLRTMTKDKDLKPNFKVLLSTSFRSPGQLKKIAGKKRYIYLTPRHLNPHMLTERRAERRLDRRLTPSPRPRSRVGWDEIRHSDSGSDSDSNSDGSTEENNG
ncbi:hypothetical protein F4802DRAFT_335597 [Xylaria palmicola]|nr:hypothetical protein F4802DRAFT_335597 [Xylaria palmicola]